MWRFAAAYQRFVKRKVQQVLARCAGENGRSIRSACQGRTRSGMTTSGDQKLGLIAGNGRFPFLLLDAARAHGLDVVVAAIKEETSPEMNDRATRDPDHVRVYLSLIHISEPTRQA